MEEELSLLDKLLDDNNNEIIELSAEGGEREQFEQIGVVTYAGAYYAILHPMKLQEDQVVVFLLDEDDEESLELVDDEQLAASVLEVYNSGK
jgi:hypothetical protein